MLTKPDGQCINTCSLNKFIKHLVDLKFVYFQGFVCISTVTLLIENTK